MHDARFKIALTLSHYHIMQMLRLATVGGPRVNSPILYQSAAWSLVESWWMGPKCPIFIRAGNEPSQRLKFHNHVGGPF